MSEFEARRRHAELASLAAEIRADGDYDWAAAIESRALRIAAA